MLVAIWGQIFQILQEERELYGELKSKHNFNTQHNMIESLNCEKLAVWSNLYYIHTFWKFGLFYEVQDHR